MTISDEMRRTLLNLTRDCETPYDCDCSVSTFQALERRGLIKVDTTFASVTFPRTSARAVITDAGRAALTDAERKEK